MNREIKFRVWDGEEYHYEIELGDGDDGCFSFGYIDDPKFSIEQYTGSKDKNGKEVYEGDILKFSDLNYKVYWHLDGWLASCPYYHKYHHPVFDHFYRKCNISVIVGNIHENPELLNEN